MAKEEKRSGRYKGDGWAAKVLERIYGNEGLSIIAPLVVGAVVYVLFLFFGKHPAKAFLVWFIPILATVQYGAIRLGLGLLMRDGGISPKRMDYGVLFFTVCLTVNAVVMVPDFLFDLNEGIQLTTVGNITAISAVALIQSRRT